MLRIEFGDLIIEQLSESSGVFTGDNIQVKWRSCEKSDSGFGTISGDCNNSSNIQGAVIRPSSEEK